MAVWGWTKSDEKLLVVVDFFIIWGDNFTGIYLYQN